MNIRERFAEWKRLRELRGHERAVLTKGAKAISDARARGAQKEELGKLLSEDAWEAALYREEIDTILTSRLVRKAQRWGIPVPPRREGSDWQLGGQTYSWILTDEGALKLRREIATEVEISQKPWLNWGAFGVAALSLMISVVTLIWR